MISRKVHSSQPVGSKAAGRLFKFDVSVPLLSMPRVVSEVKEGLRAQGLQVAGFIESSYNSSDAWQMQGSAWNHLRSLFSLDVCSFGHAGDQNLHLNVLMTATTDSWPSGMEGEIEGVHGAMQVQCSVVQ